MVRLAPGKGAVMAEVIIIMFLTVIALAVSFEKIGNFHEKTGKLKHFNL